MDNDDNYDINGNPSSQTILLIHGAVVNRKMWIPQIEILAKEYQTIAMDLPGYGSRLDQSFSLDEALADILTLNERYSTGQSLIVGSSFGGYVAMAFAQKYPDLCAGLVLAGANITPKGLLRTYLKLTSRLLAKDFVQPWLKRQVRIKTLAMFSEQMQYVSDQVCNLGLNHHMPEVFDILLHPWHDIISQYPGPILLLNGEQDKPNRRAESDFVAVARQAEICTIEDATHACNLDQPEKFCEAVTQFYMSLDKDH